MHLTPLTRALIPACAAVNAAANAEDDLYNWLQPQLKRYPDALYKYSLGELRGLLCTPGLVVIVAVSDDADEWWDDERGEEALGYATWKRRDGGREERAWRWELEARMNGKLLLSARRENRAEGGIAQGSEDGGCVLDGKEAGMVLFPYTATNISALQPSSATSSAQKRRTPPFSASIVAPTVPDWPS